MAIPIRTVLPLPANHGLSITNPNSSPFTIRTADSGGTDLATSCIPIMWSPQGEVRKVLLTAMGSHAQADAALTVTDTASTSGSFTFPDTAITDALEAGMDFIITTPDGEYRTSVRATPIQAITATKTHLVFRINQPLAAQNDTERFDNFGYLTGYITLYSDIDVIDLDLLWNTGDWDEPRGLCQFTKIEMVVPAGLRVASKIGGSYWGEGTGTVELIGAPTAGEGEVAQHPVLAQQAKVFQLTVFKDVSSDFPAWKDEWLANNGWYHTSLSGYTDNPTYYHGHNYNTPIGFHEIPMPELSATGISAAETRMTDFLTPFKAGNEAELWEADVDDAELSWTHPLGFPDINTGSGVGIYAFPYWPEVLSGKVETPDYLQNVQAGLIDRQRGFMEYKGRPFDVDEWRSDIGDDDASLGFSMAGSWASHGKYPQGVNTQWKNTGQYAKPRRFAPSNVVGDDVTKAVDFTTVDGYTVCDDNHMQRVVGVTQCLVENYWSPFNLLLLEYHTSMYLMANPDPKDTFTYGSNKGIEAGRGLGWTMWLVSWFYAHSSPTFRQSGLPKTCVRWANECYNLIQFNQMPYGGVCAWGKFNTDHYGAGNKEYELAYRDKMGPVLVDAAEAAGWSPEGLSGDTDGTWENYDYQSGPKFADLYKLFNFDNNPNSRIGYEKDAKMCHVIQSYQEAIFNLGMWGLWKSMGFPLLERWVRNTVGLLYVHRDVTNSETEPWYLVGIYEEHDKSKQILTSDDIIGVTSDIPDFYWSGWSGSEYSGGAETTQYYYRFTLSLAASYCWENSSLRGRILTLGTDMDADYETTADDSLDTLFNGEGLLAAMQQTA